jgi:hypothetical protein
MAIVTGILKMIPKTTRVPTSSVIFLIPQSNDQGGSFQLPASWQNQSELSVFENEKYNEQGWQFSTTS